MERNFGRRLSRQLTLCFGALRSSMPFGGTIAMCVGILFFGVGSVPVAIAEVRTFRLPASTKDKHDSWRAWVSASSPSFPNEVQLSDGG
jgi:hypothetical protein